MTDVYDAMRTVLFGSMATLGSLLTIWATAYNPKGAMLLPGPRSRGTKLITAGPYRWLKHPMYIGEWLMITGFAGVDSVWTAIAVGLLAELMLREWARKDEE